MSGFVSSFFFDWHHPQNWSQAKCRSEASSFKPISSHSFSDTELGAARDTHRAVFPAVTAQRAINWPSVKPGNRALSHSLSLSVSSQTPHTHFHTYSDSLFTLLVLVLSISLGPQEERGHPAAVRHRVPQLRLRAVSQGDQQYHQVRTLPKVSTHSCKSAALSSLSPQTGFIKLSPPKSIFPGFAALCGACLCKSIREEATKAERGRN